MKQWNLVVGGVELAGQSAEEHTVVLFGGLVLQLGSIVVVAAVAVEKLNLVSVHFAPAELAVEEHIVAVEKSNLVSVHFAPAELAVQEHIVAVDFALPGLDAENYIAAVLEDFEPAERVRAEAESAVDPTREQTSAFESVPEKPLCQSKQREQASTEEGQPFPSKIGNLSLEHSQQHSARSLVQEERKFLEHQSWAARPLSWLLVLHLD